MLFNRINSQFRKHLKLITITAYVVGVIVAALCALESFAPGGVVAMFKGLTFGIALLIIFYLFCLGIKEFFCGPSY